MLECTCTWYMSKSRFLLVQVEPVTQNSGPGITSLNSLLGGGDRGGGSVIGPSRLNR